MLQYFYWEVSYLDKSVVENLSCLIDRSVYYYIFLDFKVVLKKCGLSKIYGLAFDKANFLKPIVIRKCTKNYMNLYGVLINCYGNYSTCNKLFDTRHPLKFFLKFRWFWIFSCHFKNALKSVLGLPITASIILNECKVAIIGKFPEISAIHWNTRQK